VAVVEAADEAAGEADLGGAAGRAGVAAAENFDLVAGRQLGIGQGHDVLAQAADAFARQVFGHHQDLHVSSPAPDASTP
jgi:hypothetical protein